MTPQKQKTGPYLPGIDVSRETIESLELYVAELRHWNNRINLVSKVETQKFWDRHIADSAQLWPTRNPGTRRWVDLGSGGGLPGIVLAIIAAELGPEIEFFLVESDKRKAAFLQLVSAKLHLSATVIPARAEAISSLQADTLTARALAPLAVLLRYASHHMAPDGIAVFPKGRNSDSEALAALQKWDYKVTCRPSMLDSEATILQIKDISCRNRC